MPVIARAVPTPALRHIRNILLVMLAGVVVWQFGTFLMLVFVGVLLAVALNAPAQLLARHTPLNYGWSLFIVVILLLTLGTGLVLLVAPDVAGQVDEMRARIPELVEMGRSRLEQYQWGRDLLQADAGASGIVSSQRLWTGLAGAFSTTFGAAANSVLILFVGLYLAAQPDLYLRGAVFLVPDRKRDSTRELLEAAGSTLRHWLFGTLLSMLVIGLLTWIGLMLLGVPLALSLALLAAMLAFIPNIGPVLSAVPAVLLSLLDGPRLALYVALLYIGIQMVESYLVTPFIQRKTVRLPPAFTIVVQFFLGTMSGVLGLFIATPLAAVALTVVPRLRQQAGDGAKADSSRSSSQ